MICWLNSHAFLILATCFAGGLFFMLHMGHVNPLASRIIVPFAFADFNMGMSLVPEACPRLSWHLFKALITFASFACLKNISTVYAVEIMVSVCFVCFVCFQATYPSRIAWTNCLGYLWAISLYASIQTSFLTLPNTGSCSWFPLHLFSSRYLLWPQFVMIPVGFRYRSPEWTSRKLNIGWSSLTHYTSAFSATFLTHSSNQDSLNPGCSNANFRPAVCCSVHSSMANAKNSLVSLSAVSYASPLYFPNLSKIE